MLAGFVTHEYRHTVNTRFLLIPIIATLGMLVCFWSAQILLIMYAVLLPWYMIPSKAERRPVRHATPVAQSIES
jgi:hypothetical protein